MQHFVFYKISIKYWYVQKPPRLSLNARWNSKWRSRKKEKSIFSPNSAFPVDAMDFMEFALKYTFKFIFWAFTFHYLVQGSDFTHAFTRQKRMKTSVSRFATPLHCSQIACVRVWELWADMHEWYFYNIFILYICIMLSTDISRAHFLNKSSGHKSICVLFPNSMRHTLSGSQLASDIKYQMAILMIHTFAKDKYNANMRFAPMSWALRYDSGACKHPNPNSSWEKKSKFFHTNFEFRVWNRQRYWWDQLLFCMRFDAQEVCWLPYERKHLDSVNFRNRRK